MLYAAEFFTLQVSKNQEKPLKPFQDSPFKAWLGRWQNPPSYPYNYTEISRFPQAPELPQEFSKIGEISHMEAPRRKSTSRRGAEHAELIKDGYVDL